MIYKNILNKLVASKNLSLLESEALCHEMLNGHLSDPQMSAMLIALSIKGETSDEIAGFAKALKSHALNFNNHNLRIVDTCGTGGDGSNSFNISTTAAFVVAGSGITVAKHGNGSISSKCGSADVLRALGVNMLTDPSTIKTQLEELGISFLFAPKVHPKMQSIMYTRKAIEVPTIFNLIGPLCNPIHLQSQIIGVHSDYLVPIMSAAMVTLGIKNGAVVHGHGGIDELSLEGDNLVHVIKDGKIEMMTVNPRELDISLAPNSNHTTYNLNENTFALKGILSGQITDSRLDIVLLNAALCIYISGATNSFHAALTSAKTSIKSGQALNKLQKLIDYPMERKLHRPTTLFM